LAGDVVKQITPNTDVMLSNYDTLVGTPLYLSPEAIVAPEKLDGRSDLYALGAVGYFLLSGVPVFSARTVVEVCSMHLHEQPAPIESRTGRAVPAELERVLFDCLAKDPQARPRDARALAERLRACPIDRVWSDADAERMWTIEAEAKQAMPATEQTTGDAGTMQIDLDARFARDGSAVD
jgi:serine/threonine protein kinase